MSRVEIELPEKRPEPTSPRRVLGASIATFSVLVMLGAGVGLLVAPAGRSELAANATTLPAPTTAAPATAAPATAAPATTSVPATVSVPESSIAPAVRPVVETTTTTTTENPQPVAILQLTKAVQDRLELTVGDEVLVNVVTNDTGTTGEASIALTGLGELAPGFLLQSNGTLRGTAEVCGRWQAQYELTSDNLGNSTSWIDVTVNGC